MIMDGDEELDRLAKQVFYPDGSIPPSVVTHMQAATYYS